MYVCSPKFWLIYSWNDYIIRNGLAIYLLLYEYILLIVVFVLYISKANIITEIKHNALHNFNNL